jgi:hypothetical protein
VRGRARAGREEGFSSAVFFFSTLAMRPCHVQHGRGIYEQSQTTGLIDRHVRLTAESELRRKHTGGTHIGETEASPVWLDILGGESLG